MSEESQSLIGMVVAKHLQRNKRKCISNVSISHRYGSYAIMVYAASVLFGSQSLVGMVVTGYTKIKMVLKKSQSLIGMVVTGSIHNGGTAA